METNNNLIPIPGRLHSVATEGVVSGADEIYDDAQQKDQETINSELIAAVGTGGSVDSRIAAAKAEIVGNATPACDTLGEAEALISAEKTRAQAAESNLNSGKADKATTLSGYGITDAYTKSETYSKTELNNLITTPNQEYVTVPTYASLPATGEADTVYRVSNYDGEQSQVDATKYSEYAWDGTQYVFLCVKTQIGEVFDITAYNSNTKYADLTAALGTGGANIPEGLRKGGMSVKYVCSSDNKYVQYRLMADEWSIDTNDWSFYGDDVLVENPEWIHVLLDANNRILAGLKSDGSVEWSIGVPTPVKTYIDNAINEIKNGTEGTDLDGLNKIIAFLADFSTSDTLAELLATKVDKEEGKSLIDTDVAENVQYVENPEFIEVELDANGKILGGRRPDGNRFENIGVEIDGVTIETINDREGRIDISLDADKKVISYRDKDGILHENAGVETPIIKADSIKLQEKGIFELKKELGVGSVIKKYNLPKYGICNIKQETFYVSYNENIHSASDVYVIQDLEDSDENAHAKLTIAFYYLKSSLIDNGDGTYSKHNDGVEGHDVKLNFYAASKVTAVNGIPYVTSTLTEVVDPETGDVTYEVNENSVRVVQIVDTPDVRTWPVDKKTEHYCLVDINFGDYLTATNIAMGVKFQGSSTLQYRKRNFRFTFYKNTSYSKKNRVKIGEMVRCSGYNLKANFTNPERIKENVMNIIFMDIWDKRDIINRYPWDIKVNPYTGATGMIKGFPVRLNIGGSFYGVYIYGLKKDKANYCLDNDSDGMIVGSTLNTDDCWTAAKWQDYEDEMNDEMSESNKVALTTFFDFINERLYNGSDNNIYDIAQLTDVDGTMYVTSTLEGGVPVASSVSATLIPFDRDTMPERMSIVDWIDYIICLQVFYMVDNNCRNMILYTGADKKKFYPFFYDLDLSWNFGTNYTADIMIPYGEPGGSNAGDKSIWEHFKAAYWDEIRNRYFELRNSVLNTEYITEVCNSVADYIPEADKFAEKVKWGSGSFDMSGKITIMANRLLWLDSYYNKD